MRPSLLPALALAAAHLVTCTALLHRRADVQSGLSAVSRLSQGQLNGVEAVLNRSASKSWEIGTHLEALVELSYPSLSPFAPSSSWANPTPSTTPRPAEILTAVASLLAQLPTGQPQLIQDGSAADPASVGPFVALANFTLAAGGTIGGKTKEEVASAVERQVQVLMTGTPRTADGAISHRTEDVELWSDFVYMVPPFFAYFGALTRNTTLLTAAYTQCALYRSHLRDGGTGGTGLWRHIENRSEGGGGARDDEFWATGNGWAGAGMARVLAALVNHPDAALVKQFDAQSRDLAAWVGEIIGAAWGMPRASNGLLHNYLNDTRAFADASGTALLSSATFRLALLAAQHPSLPPVPASSLAAAEAAYRALIPSHVSGAGVVSPVADPMSYAAQLADVRPDGSGALSPEGEAFVLLLEAARRDWVEQVNGGREPSSTARQGASSAAAAGWRAGRSAAREVAVVLGVGVVALLLVGGG